MGKNLIIKIVIVVAVLIGGQGVFWFFKTSAAKKHVMAIVSASDGNITASKVSVAGFPFKQKIAIDDLKFQADAVAEKIYLPNKYQINVKRLEIVGSVFSNEFTANISDQVSFQDVNGNVGYVEFKQSPVINFISSKNKIQKLTYQDAGYKIVNEAKETLYEGGNSQVEFSSSEMEGGKILNNVRASFNDLQGIDIFTTKRIMFLINPAAVDSIDDEGLKPVSPTSDVAATPPSVPSDTANSAQPAPIVADAAPVANGLAKKAIQFEIEYIMAPKSEEAADKSAPPVSVSAGSLELSSVNIKNLEFSSPLYKINIAGNMMAAPASSSSAVANCNITIKIEKIENILTYVKSALASSKTLPSNVLNTPNPVITTAPAAAITTSPQNATTIDIAKATTQPDVDIVVAIMDLAKKNPNSKDNLAVFDIKKEKENDFMVNDTPLIDLARIFPAFAADIVNENY